MSEYIVCPHCHSPLSQSEYVKVVRCRDCKFCHKNYCEKLISPTASPSEIFWIPVEPDGFCKWGERQTNNKTGDFVRHDSQAERTCEMRADGAHCMNGVEFYECRSCGEYACIPTVMGKSEPPNYCPMCGAKVMDE